MVNELTHLAQADQHIVGAKLRLAQQYARIDRLSREGRDTHLAEQLVTVMESILRCYEAHRRLIQDRISCSKRRT